MGCANERMKDKKPEKYINTFCTSYVAAREETSPGHALVTDWLNDY
jgi:hypothetical protein